MKRGRTIRRADGGDVVKKKGKTKFTPISEEAEKMVVEYGKRGFPISLIVFETAIPLPIVCRTLLKNGIPPNTQWIYGLIDIFDGGWEKLSVAQQDFIISVLFEMLRNPEEMYRIIGAAGKENAAHCVGEFFLSRKELKEFLTECGLMGYITELPPKERKKVDKFERNFLITKNPYLLERYKRFVTLDLGDFFE